MRETWEKIKSFGRKVRAKIVSLLVLLGLISLPALSVDTEFTWTNPTTYTDGSPMPVSDIAEVRLFCDGNQVGTATGGVENLTVDLAPGTYDCYATVLDIYGNESVPSNTISVTIIRPNPNPPVLDPI